MSRSRAKGTAWESEIVRTLQAHGWTHAERRALNGAKDRGDVAGVAGVVIEAKCAARIELAAWLDEAIVEAANDHADVGVVWFKRRGKSLAANGFVLLDGLAFMRLLTAAGYGGDAS